MIDGSFHVALQVGGRTSLSLVVATPKPFYTCVGFTDGSSPRLDTINIPSYVMGSRVREKATDRIDGLSTPYVIRGHNTVPPFL